MMKVYSLRQQLMIWVGTPLFCAALLTILISFLFAWEEVEEVSDAQLVHSAKVLLQLTQHEIREDKDFDLGLENTHLSHPYEKKLGFRIWVGDHLITQSQNSLAFQKFEAIPGFSNATFHSHKWRFFVFVDPKNHIKIEVSERYDVRHELIANFMTSLIIPAVIFIPLVLIILGVAIRRILKPVVKMSRQIDQRSSQDLAPITTTNIAAEIAPMIAALNNLFKRIDESFQRERNFTDHATHELRTPLAAIKTQTQVLSKKLAHHPDIQDGLLNLQSSVDRATRLVEQLLSLSRLQNTDDHHQHIDLSHMVDRILHDMTHAATEKQIALTTHLAQKLTITANDIDMHLLLSNILDNAIKYTPEKGKIDIHLSDQGLLKIIDTGPGIADTDKKAVFQKFNRQDTTGQSGSGLGLSIVEHIATKYGLPISLRNNIPTGLIVQVNYQSMITNT